MTRITRLSITALIAFAFVLVCGASAQAGVGTVSKYSQRPGYLVDPLDMLISGENIPSDVDWNALNNAIPTAPPPDPNWIIADDFRDPFNTPVLTVRWWGSYVGLTFQQDPLTGAVTPLFGPGSEDGYVLSFFKDQPVDLVNPFSRPDELLATYVAPFDVVTVSPTGHVGWDGHEIWEYQVNLMDTHLEHALPGIADPDGFNQLPGEIYWLAINAEVGHDIVEVTNPDGTISWVEQDTGKFTIPDPSTTNPDGHFWGWHTSPEAFNDVATMGHLVMGPGGEWIYPQQDWQPIQPNHGLNDMAFELLTIPEPASLAIFAVGVSLLSYKKRRS